MRTKTGTATSTKASKTVTVTVHSYKRHPKYFKSYRTTKTFHAHDENEVVQEGDTVTIAECRPLSKLKRWRVVEVNGQPVESVKKPSKKTENTVESEPAVTE